MAMPGGNAPGGDARGKQDRGNTRWQCQSFRYCGTGPAQGSIIRDQTFDVGAFGGAVCVYIPWEYSLCGWGGGRYSTVIVQAGRVPGQGGR